MKNQSFRRSVLQLLANPHLSKPTIHVIFVHIEIVHLERISIHTSVDRIQVDVFLGLLWIKVDDHLERRNMNRVEYRVRAVLSELAACYIERIVVASSVDFPVEEEFKRGLAPRQVGVLPGVQLAPSPVFWAI